MQSFKLLLPIGSLLVAGRALAYKASHAMANFLLPVRTTSWHTDARAIPPPGSIRGHGSQGLATLPGAAFQGPL